MLALTRERVLLFLKSLLFFTIAVQFLQICRKTLQKSQLILIAFLSYLRDQVSRLMLLVIWKVIK
ncbi:hypothetical protein PCC7418_3536 [Halothece sp. PCC 7418]|nr:hypothetical protein PCC7418_3536 [Halothece sp. PCC 7418]